MTNVPVDNDKIQTSVDGEALKCWYWICVTIAGGVVDEAVRSLCFFLPIGQEVCSLKGNHPKSNYSYKTKHEPYDTLMPIVILTNSSTISAGVLFVGAMQDYDRAVIIGQRTKGKGLVQGTRKTAFGTTLYITTARCHSCTNTDQ